MTPAINRNRIGQDVKKGSELELKNAQKQKVLRLEDWDEARYSFVPPSAALDKELTTAHLRLLILIGRVNTQKGWCEASQKGMAEFTSLQPKTVNDAIRLLVKRGYLQKKTQKETRSSFCHYRVKIDPEGGPSISGTPTIPPAKSGTRSSNSRTSFRSGPDLRNNKLARASDQKIKDPSSRERASEDLKSGVGSEGPHTSPAQVSPQEFAAWAASLNAKTEASAKPDASAALRSSILQRSRYLQPKAVRQASS